MFGHNEKERDVPDVPHTWRCVCYKHHDGVADMWVSQESRVWLLLTLAPFLLVLASVAGQLLQRVLIFW